MDRLSEEFEAFNVALYWALVNVVLDVVLWCLGPLVDDSREYGYPRLCLAAVTNMACRSYLRRTGQIGPND